MRHACCQCAAASAGKTWGFTVADSERSGCASGTSGGEACSPGIGPASRSTPTSQGSRTGRSAPPTRSGSGAAGNPTSSSEAPPARTSAAPASARGSAGSDPDCSSRSCDSGTRSGSSGRCGRTCGAPSLVTGDWTSWRSWVPSWAQPSLFPPPESEGRVWQPGRGGASSGDSSTLSISESPRDVVACSLSDVLEGSVHPRFFLNPRAAGGILRRAERRGRVLPGQLHSALDALAGPDWREQRDEDLTPDEQAAMSLWDDDEAEPCSPSPPVSETQERTSRTRRPGGSSGKGSGPARSAAGHTGGETTSTGTARTSPEPSPAATERDPTPMEGTGSSSRRRSQSKGSARGSSSGATPESSRRDSPGEGTPEATPLGDGVRTIQTASPQVTAFHEGNGLDPQASATTVPTIRSGRGGASVHQPPPEERPMGFLLGVENRDIPRDDGLSPPPVKAGPPRTTSADGLRRLTPTECERLMGWPDGWTVT